MFVVWFVVFVVWFPFIHSFIHFEDLYSALQGDESKALLIPALLKRLLHGHLSS